MVFCLGDGREQGLWHRAHVDNLGVLGQVLAAVRRALDEKVAAFNKLRLDVHEVEIFESKGAALGA
eukprot:1118599-Pyramimonas_sp.AAC.1